MDFVALDFETANSRADSACQLAVVIVRDQQIVDEHCWLVRPPRMYFSKRNISIHGIRPAHVANAPTMQELWPRLEPILDGQVLLAHNAGFDIGVLVASLAAFDMACPTLEFSCTRAIARRAWPGRSRYGLKPLGTWLGIDFKHHDALEDARCCANIALAAARPEAFASFELFEKALRLSRGRYCLGQIRSPRQIGTRAFVPRLCNSQMESKPDEVTSHQALAAEHVHSIQSPLSVQHKIAFSRPAGSGRGSIDPVTILEAAAGSQPLAHKHVVCLGALRGLTIDDTRKLIEALGGQFHEKIRPGAHFVVACGGLMLQDASQMLAREQAGDGAIRLLSERQFLSLLPGGKAAVRW